MRINELSKPNSVEESDRVADKGIKRLIPATESTISAMNQVRPNWAGRLDFEQAIAGCGALIRLERLFDSSALDCRSHCAGIERKSDDPSLHRNGPCLCGNGIAFFFARSCS